MNKTIYVLTERDPVDGNTIVIGVSDSLENADKMMSDYYKEFEVKRFKDVRDSGIEWYKDVELTDINGSKYYYTCILESFILNNVYHYPTASSRS